MRKTQSSTHAKERLDNKRDRSTYNTATAEYMNIAMSHEKAHNGVPGDDDVTGSNTGEEHKPKERESAKRNTRLAVTGESDTSGFS